MKKQILFSTRTCKHESGLDSENRNKLQRAISEECDRATAAEEELLLRLQGVSEDSNPVTDPFKFLGAFSTYDEFNSAISTLACLDVDKGCGYFRARVVDSAIDIKNVLLSSEQNIIGQLVQGMLQVGSNGELASADTSYKLYFRKYQDGDWDEWKEVTGGSSSDNADLSDYVTTETFRLTTNQLMGYADRGDAAVKNSLKTINGQSIIKSSSDDSDNIEITGGDGNVDLSGYVTDAELTPIKEKVDGIEEGANKYTHPSEGYIGTYAAYNPEDFFQDVKILNIPTLTVNKYGHVTAAGENQVALPTFKTINGTSIVKTDTDDSDNIEITGGDGNVDLSGYVTDAELAGVKTSLETKIDTQDAGLRERIVELENTENSLIELIYTVQSEIPDLRINNESIVDDSKIVNLEKHFKTINGNSLFGSEDITISGGDGGNVDLSDYVTKEEFETLNTMAVKTIQINNYSLSPEDNGDGFVDLGLLATKDELATKQDAISDLDVIRSGAAKGATALQQETYRGTVTGISINNEPVQEPDGNTGVVNLTITQSGGEENVQSDWNETVDTSDAFIKNKPTFKTINGVSVIGTGNIEITTGDGGLTSESDPIFTASPAAGITEGNITDWNNKLDATDAENTFLKKTAKAASATTADSATKATKDGSGNTITSTYATKTELNNSKANWNATSGSAQILNKPTFRKINGWSLISGDDNLSNNAFFLADSIKVNNKEKMPENNIGTIVLGQVVTDVKVGGNSVVTVDESAGTCVANITLTKGEKGDAGADGADGVDGVGITSVKQTTTSTTDGGNNVITVTLSNGTTSTFNVKNGSKGSQGEKGAQGEKGEKGDAGADGADGVDGVGITSVKQTTTSTTDGGNNVITVTLSNGTTSTFNVKNGSKGSQGEKGEKGDAGADGSAAYPLVNHGTSNTTFTLTPNTFHVWGTVSSLKLTLGSETSGVANEYLFQFSCSSSVATTLSLPSSVMWANGETPIIEVMKTYQVSILNNCATILSFG